MVCMRPSTDDIRIITSQGTPPATAVAIEASLPGRLEGEREVTRKSPHETSHSRHGIPGVPPRPSLIRIYTRALSILGREKVLAWMLVVANVGLAGVMLVEPWLFGQVVDAVSAKRTHDAWRSIGSWATIGVLGMCAGVLLSLNADRLAHRCRQAVITQFIETVLTLPLSFHDRNHTGRLLGTLHSGMNHLFVLWLSFFRTHLSTVISILVMVPVALYLNWKLAIVMIASMATFLMFSTLMVRRTNLAQVQVEELNQKVSERIGDLFSNVMIVQSFLRTQAEVRAVREMLDQVLKTQFPLLRGWALVSVAQQAASTLTVVLIFALGVYLNSRDEISVGGIVSFVGFAMFMMGRLEQLARFVSDLSGQARSLERFFTVLDSDEGIKDRADAADMRDVRGEIVFDNVSFHYASPHAEGTRQALSQLSFKVLPGQTAALVGATGAGKTTALALLYRAYDPASGRILIDGVDVRNVTLASLRSHLAVVFQDPGLLFRSIAENLFMGNPEATPRELEEAATAAQAHDFITRKANGYATMVTERGRSLSGGERQRLAIARAMLKDAPILILDEATSALDHATEVQVQLALRALTKRRTTLVIAHRLSTIRHADVILVLKEGELVEQGTFDELIRRNGVFAKLARSGEFTADGELPDVGVTAPHGAQTTESTN